MNKSDLVTALANRTGINKADAADPGVLRELEERYGAVSVSAVTGQGLDQLRRQLAAVAPAPQAVEA